MSKISWTEQTWNPVTGCSKISAGCMNCYAAVMAERLRRMGQPLYNAGFDVCCHDSVLDKPLHWKKPRTIFVCSMGDLYHDDVPDAFIHKVFEVMLACPQHCFQLLTKRANRLAAIAPSLPWAENIWQGVTVENANELWRVDRLRTVPASIRFLSIEPMLGRLPNLDLTGIDWVIVGGEKCPGAARPMHESWVRDVRDQCIEGGVPFHFKQWGGNYRENLERGRLVDGALWNEIPDMKTV